MPKGIKNFGNSCYMSAALQSSICILEDIFKTTEYIKYVDKKQIIPIIHISDVILSVADDSKNEWNEFFHNTCLHNFITDIKHNSFYFPQFSEKIQSDSFIFFIRLLDFISDSIQMKIKSIKINGQKEENLRFGKYLQKNLTTLSPIDKRINGYIISTINCEHKNCKQKNNNKIACRHAEALNI